MNPKNTAPRKKTIFFAAILFPIIILFVLFLVLVSYHMVVERFGDPELQEEIAQKYGQKIETQKAQQVSSISEAVNALIHPHNPQLGPPDAPITLIMFIDFECPFCSLSFPILESVIETYGPALRVVFKHTPIESIHPLAKQASVAAQCAHEQNQFWAYYRLLFSTEQLDTDSLITHAKTLNLNLSTFSTCLTSEEIQKQILTDLQDGLTLKLKGTPTYIINNQKVEGVVPKETWDSIILNALQK